MRQGVCAIATAVLALSACDQDARRQPISNAAQPINAAQPEAPPPIPPPATGPDAKTPLAEPKGASDPKSIEAAGQVVQRFGALIEQNRFDEAAKLWSDERAAGAFREHLHPSTHLKIGSLGETEGAAGSIYTTIPVVLYGDTFQSRANIILRRVNEVPGSTAAQRRWHIERIEWKDAT